MMTSPEATTENHCYRHTDRETFVKCQRCGRPICGQCQTLAPVGVHCPECVREARGSAASTARPLGRRIGRVLSPRGGLPIVSYTLIALNLIIYGIQFFTGDAVTDILLYAPIQTATEPWRMLTALFAHESIFHVGLNMLSLWLVGPALESIHGRVRFIALYLVAGFAGSVGVLLLAPINEGVVGASGAIFGLFGAYFIIARRLGGNTTFLLVVIVANLVYGFLPGTGIAWQAHVGGLVVGSLIGLIYLKTRHRRRRWIQFVLLGVIVALLVVATVVKATLIAG